MTKDHSTDQELPGAGVTERGFSTYAEFGDLNGATVTVQESSLATERAVWVQHHGGTRNAHLSIDGATILRNALDAFLADAHSDQMIADTTELLAATPPFRGDLDELIRAIAREEITIMPAEMVRAGHVTLWGAVTDTKHGHNTVTLNTFGGGTRITDKEDQVVILGSVAQLSLSEINAGQ